MSSLRETTPQERDGAARVGRSVVSEEAEADRRVAQLEPTAAPAPRLVLLRRVTRATPPTPVRISTPPATIPIVRALGS